MKVLVVLTSHDQLGNTGIKTGFWLEEFASPYYYFLDAGVEVTLASPQGGQPPLDPKSDESDFQTSATARFKADPLAQKVLANTKKLSDMRAEQFDAVFYPGGHGPLWDLKNDQHSIQLIESFVRAGKPVASVCHAPAVLLNAKNLNGEALVKDKRVTGFSNSEETAVGLIEVVPFLLENALISFGAHYERTDDWACHVVVDELIITGQNPGSSEAVAEALLKALS